MGFGVPLHPFPSVAPDKSQPSGLIHEAGACWLAEGKGDNPNSPQTLGGQPNFPMWVFVRAGGRACGRACGRAGVRARVWVWVWVCVCLRWFALHCVALRCVALHCIAFHCIALHVWGSFLSWLNMKPNPWTYTSSLNEPIKSSWDAFKASVIFVHFARKTLRGSDALNAQASELGEAWTHRWVSCWSFYLQESPRASSSTTSSSFSSSFSFSHCSASSSSSSNSSDHPRPMLADTEGTHSLACRQRHPRCVMLFFLA